MCTHTPYPTSQAGVVLLFGAFSQEDERGSGEHSRRKPKVKEGQAGRSRANDCHYISFSPLKLSIVSAFVRLFCHS